jgi:hypothetical protein
MPQRLSTLKKWFNEEFADKAEAVGIACGMNDLVVIDLDAKPGKANGVEGFGELLADLNANDHEVTLHGVPTIITPSGGRHLFFRQPDEFRIGCGTGRLPPGIDVRGDGGQVIAVGCRLGDGGVYRPMEGSPDLIEAFRAGTIRCCPRPLPT